MVVVVVCEGVPSAVYSRSSCSHCASRALHLYQLGTKPLPLVNQQRPKSKTPLLP